MFSIHFHYFHPVFLTFYIPIYISYYSKLSGFLYAMPLKNCKSFFCDFCKLQSNTILTDFKGSFFQ